MLIWARRASQGCFLALFLLLFLQTEQKGADHLGYPVKLFLDGDPLLALATACGGDAPPANLGLESEPATQRLAGLMARIANARGAVDEARAWIARGAQAPVEPEWSDLDTAGQAFNYGVADWARLVSVYAETGDLAHPRYERGDAVITDLPRLPAAYEGSAVFISAAEAGGPLPPIVDDGDFGDALRPSASAPTSTSTWGFLSQGGRKAR